MNPKPIETAHDADLRLSHQALQRAAQKARDLAQQTGTAIVIFHNGVLELVGEARSTPLRDTHQPGNAAPSIFEGRVDPKVLPR